MEMLRTTRCEINLDKLKYNIDRLKDEIGPDVEAMAVIKADAYGHGAATMMGYMMKYGIRYFAVASLNEAMELRRAHKDGEVLVLGISPDELLHYGAENNIMQTVQSYRQAKVLSDLGINAKIMIKMDSGMHRLGFRLCDEAIDEVEAISKLPSLNICGIFTHLALKDREADLWQWDNFQKFIARCEERGIHFPLKSICDGIATIRYPEMRMNMVRPGSFFYGFNPQLKDLQPIMELKSEIVHLQTVVAGEGLGYDLSDPVDHDRVVATLPFGYVDGCPRAMSHGAGWVSVRGVKCPIIGLMCMDQCTIDVTDVPDVQIGDTVTIFSEEGGMDYRQGASISNFNRNGLQAATPRRVPKLYFENGELVAARDYMFDLD